MLKNRFITISIRFFQNRLKFIERKWENYHPVSFKKYDLFRNGISKTLDDIVRFTGNRSHLMFGGHLETLSYRDLENIRKMPSQMLKLFPIFLAGTMPMGITLIPFLFYFPRRLLIPNFWTAEQRGEFERAHQKRISAQSGESRAKLAHFLVKNERVFAGSHAHEYLAQILELHRDTNKQSVNSATPTCSTMRPRFVQQILRDGFEFYASTELPPSAFLIPQIAQEIVSELSVFFSVNASLNRLSTAQLRILCEVFSPRGPASTCLSIRNSSVSAFMWRSKMMDQLRHTNCIFAQQDRYLANCRILDDEDNDLSSSSSTNVGTSSASKDQVMASSPASSPPHYHHHSQQQLSLTRDQLSRACLLRGLNSHHCSIQEQLSFLKFWTQISLRLSASDANNSLRLHIPALFLTRHAANLSNRTA